MRGLVILLLVTSLLSHARAYGAPSRPEAGIGILLVRPTCTEVDAAGNTLLTLYAEPGMKKVAEVNPADIPPFFAVSDRSSDEFPLLVREKRNEWLKIAYDDAGREAWLRMQRTWRYTPWSTLLKGQKVFMLAKLRRSDYTLRKQPSVTSLPLGNIGVRQLLQVVEVDGDWVKVDIPSSGSGYLRWRGDDGRMTVSIGNVVP